MDNKDVAHGWFRKAETDYESAVFLKKMEPMPSDVICYHSQQSAEKYLKGYLAL